MSTWQYAIGLVITLGALAITVATPFLLAHSRTRHDHGPGCWWCHPHLPGRRPRR
ncbi:hypothetical protein [Streptomyces sp. C10-9-1]|uniref:hypothetical protein n=1 Tax=Streptomyces sp. C10-9-1 TaxID=1859285 RepID=UPI003F4A1076